MKNESVRSSILAAMTVMVLLLVAPVVPARATGIVVTNAGDTTVNGDGCTLREAIINANDNAATWPDCAAGSGADTITFGLSGTIRLGSALPNITDAAGLTINGAGQNVIVSGDTDGNGTPDIPIFTVNAGSALSVQTLTLAKGNADPLNCGGAVLNDGGVVSVVHSIISGNHAALSGGGLCNRNGGAMTVTSSTLSGNSAQWGAGIQNASTMTVTNSTFSGNSAVSEGGGMNNGVGTAIVINSSFSGNSAIWGGAIGVDEGVVTVTNSTFSANTATYGDTAFNGTGTVTFRNSILTASPSGANCSGTITNGGNNIDSGTGCNWASNSGSMSSTNPQLGALANNGGPTQTMALQATSPAIDAGNATVCALALPNGPGGLDQRGVAHKGICDIGAFEYGMKLRLPLVMK